MVAAIPDGASSVLRGVPEDQLERMRQQAAAFGPGALSRAADIVNAGLTEMSGATAPRLQLELICARVLLPGASGESGYAARLDRLERRLDVGGSPTQPQAPPLRSPSRGQAPAPATARQAASPDAEAQAGPAQVEPQTAGAAAGRAAAGPGRRTAAAAASGAARAVGPGAASRAGAAGRGAPGAASARRSADPATPGRAAAGTSGRAAGTGATGGPAAGTGSRTRGSEPARRRRPLRHPGAQRTPGGIDTDAIRRSWPDVLAKVFSIKRVTWTFLSEHAQVLDYDGRRLLLGISTIGLANTFRKGQHAELVRQALIEVLGVDAVVEGIPTPESGGGPTPASSAAAPTAPSPAPEPPPDQGRSAGGPSSPDREGLRVMAAASPAPDDLGPEPDDDWSAPSAPPPEWATEAVPRPA